MPQRTSVHRTIVQVLPRLAGVRATGREVNGLSLAPVQVSPILVNAEEPVRVILSAALAAVPELVSVNVWDAVWPGFKVL